MQSNQEAADQLTVSPVLFLSVSGKPLRFYLRPGPTKVQLQPHIKAGGGVVSRSQESQTILLADPEEMSSMAESAAHWYVSTQYITDCVEQNQQLEMERYRFTSQHIQTRSTRQRLPPAGRSSERKGRLSYTPEEDAAILKFISKRQSEVGGNQVWQEMEKKRVTNHSWQSMKHRYIKHLVHRLVEEVEERTGGDTKEVPEDRLPAQPDSQLDSPPPQKLLQAEESPSSSPVSKRTRSSPESSAENAESPSDAENAESPSDAENAESLSDAENAESSSDAVSQKAAGEQPSPKRARLEEEPAATSGEAVAAVVQQGATQGGEETHRKLGILEMASREFNDSRESDEDTQVLIKTSVGAEPSGTETSSAGPSLQENVLEAQASRDVPPVKAAYPGAAASKPAPSHLFVFESDSQEEEPRPVANNDTAASSSPQPISSKDTVVSLTQAQLEEDKERIRGLMKQTNQDLLTVTKALLKSSGDFSAALRLLLAPCPLPVGTFWNCHDDCLLLSSDPTERQRLEEKHGQEGVAKRLAFLDLV